MLSFECKCKLAFCVSCRLPEVHKCKNIGDVVDKSDLQKKLQKVQAQKITLF
jgi:predicted nucleic acid binding AN1-type Zn finger protein